MCGRTCARCSHNLSGAKQLSKSSIELPPFPGEEPLSHAAAQWREAVESRLAAAQLLGVAEGGLPPAAEQIIDYPLDQIPELPAEHRDHERRRETRIAKLLENKVKEHKRHHLTMSAWTELYAAIARSTEATAPMFHRELRDLCDLSAHAGSPVVGGQFDGPRAWRLALAKLAGSGPRAKADKEFLCTSGVRPT